MENLETEVSETDSSQEDVEVNEAESDVVEKDAWEEAEESFDEPLEESDTASEEPEEEIQQDKDESHLEQGQPDDNLNKLLDLKDLKCPEKFKPFVKERIEKIAEEVRGQAEKQVAEAKQYSEELGGDLVKMVNVFRDIAENPDRLLEYVEKFGGEIGIDAEAIKSKRSQSQKPEVKLPSLSKESLESLNSKYLEKMISTDDPREFYRLMTERDSEMASLRETHLLGEFGNLLKAYHQQYVAPNASLISEFKTDSEQRKIQGQILEQKSSWNSALTKLEKDNPGIKSYEQKLIQLIKTDPDFQLLRDEANKNPKDVERRVKILSKAYKLVKSQEPPKPKLKGSGIRPTQKHVSTTRTDGASWEEIEQEFFS